MLLNKLSKLEKALNRTINKDKILKIVENYVEKGIIINHSIKSENKNPSANKLDMDLRGDIM